MFEIANKIKEYLVDFLESHKEDLKVSTIEQMENNILWKQARAMFTTMAMLLDYEPDTYQGDTLLNTVYDSAKLDNNIVDQNDFDLYMWSNLC